MAKYLKCTSNTNSGVGWKKIRKSSKCNLLTLDGVTDSNAVIGPWLSDHPTHYYEGFINVQLNKCRRK